MSKRLFSYMSDLRMCPQCGIALTGEGFKTVGLVTGSGEHHCNIGGDDGDFYRSYLLDAHDNDCCLITDHKHVAVHCLACQYDLTDHVQVVPED